MSGNLKKHCEGKYVLITGIRPDFIRCSEIIKEFRSRRVVPFCWVNTGQHYDFELREKIIEDMDLDSPDISLENVSKGMSQFETIGQIMEDLEELFSKGKPRCVVALGDTNSVLATALVTKRLGIPFVHLEGGMRSFNDVMPEEQNRKIADLLADYIVCYTHRYKENLILEGKNPESIFVSGNTMIDIVRQAQFKDSKPDHVLKRLGLDPNVDYVVAEMHRKEFTSSKKRMEEFFEALDQFIIKHPEIRIIFPIHPTTDRKMKEYSICCSEGVKFNPPMGYRDYKALQNGCLFEITDSGSTQETMFFLEKPCVVVRESTERPETVNVGATILCGYDGLSVWSSMEQALNRQLTQRDEWDPDVLGDLDDNIAVKIVDYITGLDFTKNFNSELFNERKLKHTAFDNKVFSLYAKTRGYGVPTGDLKEVKTKENFQAPEGFWEWKSKKDFTFIMEMMRKYGNISSYQMHERWVEEFFKEKGEKESGK